MKSGIGICGIYKITICDCSTQNAKKIAKQISNGNSNLINQFHDLFAEKQFEFKNIVPNVAL